MDEEKRTLTTECSNTVVDVNATKGSSPVLPQYAIDIMAEFFLKKIREEYTLKHNINQ